MAMVPQDAAISKRETWQPFLLHRKTPFNGPYGWLYYIYSLTISEIPLRLYVLKPGAFTSDDVTNPRLAHNHARQLPNPGACYDLVSTP